MVYKRVRGWNPLTDRGEDSNLPRQTAPMCVNDLFSSLLLLLYCTVYNFSCQHDKLSGMLQLEQFSIEC